LRQVPLNGTLSVLARAPSPPPQQLSAGTEAQDEDEAEVSEEALPESSGELTTSSTEY